MSFKNIKQCTICEQWLRRNNGGFMKHIRTWQQQVSLQSSTDKKCPRSSNLLLSITTDYQSPEIDYDCDFYSDHSFDQTNLEVNNDDSFTDGDSIISSHYDSLEQYYPIHNHTQDKEDFVCNNSPQRSNAGNRFQVMLHDLIMKHKASLQMFDNICNLVNEFTSSPDFSANTKLQYWKSFLHSVKGSYRTRLLRPCN
jgi:hypothetical protein